MPAGLHVELSRGGLNTCKDIIAASARMRKVTIACRCLRDEDCCKVHHVQREFVVMHGSGLGSQLQPQRALRA